MGEQQDCIGGLAAEVSGVRGSNVGRGSTGVRSIAKDRHAE